MARRFHANNDILYRQLLTTEQYEHAKNPDFLKVSLYPHQAVALKSLKDLEENHILLMRDGTVIQSDVVVLSEQFGSGKTLICIAMCDMMKKMYPHVYAVDNDMIATRKYISSTALIRSNLIIVGSTVLVQWENAIREFTTLKYFTIGEVHSLREFLRLYAEDKISQYDIILLKNGDVTSNVKLPCKVGTTSKDLYNLIDVVRMVTKNKCWLRVFYDDYDTSHIPTYVRLVNALFSILVSATEKIMKHSRAAEDSHIINSLESAHDFLTSKSNPILATLCEDKALFTNYNVRNTPLFTEESTKITIMNCYKYVYEMVGEKYVDLLGAIGGEEARDLMEMANGEAKGEMAKRMGMESTSMADIFQRVLDNNTDEFIKCKKIIDAIGRMFAAIDKLHPDPDGVNHSETALHAYKETIKTGAAPRVHFTSPSLVAMLEDMRGEYKRKLDIVGRAMHRVLDNLREGMCQICNVDLNNYDVFINKCCGLIICDECGIKGNQIGYKHNYRSRKHQIMGSCANCKAEILPSRDLIFVTGDFDITQLLEARGDEDDLFVQPEERIEPIEPDNPIEPDSLEGKLAAIENPKVRALIKICLGVDVAERQDDQITVHQLMVGRVDIPQRADTPRKIIIFAGFDETLGLIKKQLEAFDISYLRLEGDPTKRDRIAKEFKTTVTALLINSSQTCAGLNLQFATDMVSFHEINDEAVKSQIFGRGQRIGRTCNLRIHRLLYKNENK